MSFYWDKVGFTFYLIPTIKYSANTSGRFWIEIGFLFWEIHFTKVIE